MRFFGIITNEGIDPFSLSQELDRFLVEHEVQKSEPFLIYRSDPNSSLLACWGAYHSAHVVLLRDSDRMVRDFISTLLVVDVPESYGAYQHLSFGLYSDDILECTMKGAEVVTLTCKGCPI